MESSKKRSWEQLPAPTAKRIKGREGQVWREGAETQDGERKVKQSAEGKPKNM